jgi:hypothetical protein
MCDTKPASSLQRVSRPAFRSTSTAFPASTIAYPFAYETIIDTARRNSIIPNHAHNTMSPQQAVDLVSDHAGVAILAEAPPQGFKAEGVVIKQLSDASLLLQTCVVMRGDDDSRLLNEYVRSFLRRYFGQRLPPKTESPLSSRVTNWKTRIRSSNP